MSKNAKFLPVNFKSEKNANFDGRMNFSCKTRHCSELIKTSVFHPVQSITSVLRMDVVNLYRKLYEVQATRYRTRTVIINNPWVISDLHRAIYR